MQGDRDQGRDDEALTLSRTVEEAAAEDDVDAQVQWRSVRAPILARSGDLIGAEQLVAAALELARASEAPVLQADTLCELAEVLLMAGRTSEALAVNQEAINLYSAKGDIVSARRTRAWGAKTNAAAGIR